MPLEGNGNISVYSAIIMGVVMGCAGFWLLSTLPGQTTGMVPMILFVGAFAIPVVGITSGNNLIRKARAHSAAEQRYRDRREQLQSAAAELQFSECGA